MEYYILSQEESYHNTVSFEKAHFPPELRSICAINRKLRLDFQNVPFQEKSFNLRVKSGEEIYYPDLIETPLLFISDRLKTVFFSYESRIHYNCTILSDLVHKRQEVYWLCALEEADCLGKSAKFYPDHSLKKLVLDKKKIGNRKIFYISGIRENRIVVHFDVAESILRRPFTGICMKKVCLEG